MKQPRPERLKHYSSEGGSVPVRLVGLVIALAANGAWAQDSGAQADTPRGIFIQPRVSLSETYTTNNLLTSSGEDAALLTVLTPGVLITARGGSITGTLDYSLSGIAYAKSPQPDRIQQNLNATGRVDFVRQVFFVDATASISQQTNSVTGPQSADPNLGYGNRVEVQTVTVSPTLRGHLGSWAALEVRGSATGTNTMDSSIGDSRLLNGSFRLDSLSDGKIRGWGLLSTTKAHYKANAADNDATQAMLGLRFQPDIDLVLNADGGRERSNYLTGTDQDSTLYGASAAWTPTPRTVVNADWQHHVYGNSHSLQFEHRMARSVWRYSDSQSVTQASKLNTVDLGSNYDLFFLQFSAVEPDPVKRDALVRNTLLNLGLNPNAQIIAGFLSNVPVLARSQQAAFSLEGVRTTVTASMSQTKSKQVGTSAQVAGDLANFSLINQRGYSLNVAHRLTPVSGLSFSYSQIHNEGVDPSTLNVASTLRSITANWTCRLGPKSTVGLTARTSREVGSNPYRENAVVASFVQNF